jgi:predicted DNA-binding protein
MSAITSQPVGIRLPLSMYRKLQEIAAELNAITPHTPTTVSALIRRAIEEWLKEHRYASKAVEGPTGAGRSEKAAAPHTHPKTAASAG